MALGRAFLSELIELKRTGALDGATRLVEIGAQQLANCFLRAESELDEIYALYGATRPSLGTPVWAGSLNRIDLLHPDAPSSEPFWTSLGFAYTAIDYGGIRGAVGLDLNRDIVPPALRGKFDFLVNTGTTEHVANQDNAFRVIHDLVAPSGLMLHAVPSGGMMTHGFFSYNLRFFWHLCRENEYVVIKLLMAPFAVGPVHPDVLQSNEKWGRGADHPAFPAEIWDLSILAILRKPADQPFRTPLDVPA